MTGTDHDWGGLSLEETAALVQNHLRSQGIESVLVGGACVSIYSRKGPLSWDLDFVTYRPQKDVVKAMADLGFQRSKGRELYHEGCPFYADFVAPPLAIGNAPVEQLATLQTRFGPVTMLTLDDCVKDRLAAFIHWKDRQSLEQAKHLLQAGQVDKPGLIRWLKGEKADATITLLNLE